MRILTEERVERARELGLPTNVEDRRWYTRDGTVPIEIRIVPNSFGSRAEDRVWSPDRGDVPARCLFLTEKEAINEARKFALGAEQAWQKTIDMLDKRFDTIEDAEMAQEKRRINDPD